VSSSRATLPLLKPAALINNNFFIFLKNREEFFVVLSVHGVKARVLSAGESGGRKSGGLCRVLTVHFFLRQ
jgi:hypothetical protein